MLAAARSVPSLDGSVVTVAVRFTGWPYAAEDTETLSPVLVALALGEGMLSTAKVPVVSAAPGAA